MEQIKCFVCERDVGERLDRVLAKLCGLSRMVMQRLIAEGNVLVNDKPAAKGYRVAEGDKLEVTIPPPEESEVLAEEIPLDVIYEDEHLLVINKPKGMVVHPAAGNLNGTMVNALLYHCKGGLSGIGGEIRPGIVHRIDKDTSGLLVVAKDDKTHQGLAEQFAAHTIEREYQAVVYGHFKEPTGEIDAPIGRSKTDRKKMAVTPIHSKRAVTCYEVLAEYPGFSHVALRLQTGRTHQIRVHMAEIGHPLAGDRVYGPRKAISSLQGQCLHAMKLGFCHPITGEWVSFTSPLPAYFTGFLKQLPSETEG